MFEYFGGWMIPTPKIIKEPTMRSFESKEVKTIYKFILPWFILFCFALVIPIFTCLGISFTSWRGGPKINFNGIDNYVRLVQDAEFWNAFGNNLELMAYLIVGQIGFAFVFALMYNSKLVRFKELHRRLIFLPCLLAPAVVGMVWQLVYRIDIGIFAILFRSLNLENWIIPWLDSPKLVMPAISIVLIWQYVGQYCLIIMAGMQNINKSVLEAAEIDGTTAIQRAFYIVFPLLKSTIFVLLMLVISGCMKLFDIFFIMTNGGPGNSSMVAVLYSYNLAFHSNKLGYGSTSAIGVVLLSFLLIIIMKQFTKRIADEN